MNSNRAHFVDQLLEGTPQKIIVFGTSLSFHLAPLLRIILKSRFGDRVSVINSGLSGRASRTALSCLEDKVLRHQPDFLFLEWAINDAHDFHHEPDSLDAGISPEESRDNLNTLLSRVEAAQPSCEIVLWTTNPTFDTATSSMRGASARPELQGYYQVVREVASARGLKLVDAEHFWNSLRARDENEFRALLPDGVHPTPKALREHLVPFLLDELGISNSQL